MLRLICVPSPVIFTFIVDSFTRLGFILTICCNFIIRRLLSDCCTPTIGPGVAKMVLLLFMSLDVLFKVDQRGKDG